MTYDAGLCLLLEDAIRLTEEGRRFEPILEGLALLRRGGVTTEEEREIFRGLLDHGWTTTAPFDQAVWALLSAEPWP